MDFFTVPTLTFGVLYCFFVYQPTGVRFCSDVLGSVNGTASKCKTFLATATEECCPARGTLAGHFTRRLSPSPMPGKRNTTAAGLPATQKKQSAPAILSTEAGSGRFQESEGGIAKCAR